MSEVKHTPGPCPFCGSPGIVHQHAEIPEMWIAGCSEERGECIGVQAAYDFVSRETAVAAWNARVSPPVSDEQIKHLVDRFLGWRLPENFRPDCGIHFDAHAAKKLNPRNLTYEPVGTNLFDSTQAEQMVRYMLEGLPRSAISAAEGRASTKESAGE